MGYQDSTWIYLGGLLFSEGKQEWTWGEGDWEEWMGGLGGMGEGKLWSSLLKTKLIS